MKILELIKSLSKKEENKVLAYLKDSKNHVLLDFYLSLKEDKSVNDIKQKNIYAYRLEQIILDILAQTLANTYFESKLLKIIIETEVLFRRNLFSLALKRIHQANKLLDIYEISYYRLLVNRWENIIRKEMPVSASEDLSLLSNLWEDAKQISKKEIPQSIEIRFRTYYNLLLSRYRLENEKFSKYKFKKELVDNINYLSGENRILALNNNAFIYFSTQEYEKALKLFEELTSSYEQFEEPHKLFPNDYFITLNNLMLVTAICGDYNDVEIIKNKIYGFYKNNKDFNLQLFMVTESYLLSIYCETKDVEKGQLIVKKIKSNYKMFEKSISPAHKFLLLFNMSLMNFYMNDFKQSLYWIMKIIYSSINKKRSVYLSNIYYYAYFLYCLNHFEMKHFDLLSEQFKGILNTLNNVKKVDGLELELLSKLCHTLSEKDEKENIRALSKFRFDNARILQFIDVKQWLLKKLSD